MPWFEVILGLVILTMGRQLFWLFVAAVGFVYGMDLAPSLFPAQPAIVQLLVAILAGFIGAVFAYFLEWIAVAAAGFLVGGRLAALIVTGIGAATSEPTSIAFLIGGIIGAILVLMVFDWALILLSSAIGAMMIAAVVKVGPNMTLLVLGGLAALGVIVQAAHLQRSRVVHAA